MRIILFFIFTLLFISCESDLFYQNSVTYKQGWNEDSASVFDIHIADVASPYQLFVDIRHNKDYPYQNFWCFLETQIPDKSLHIDTLALYLANNEGKWLGNTSTNNLIAHHILFEKDFFFKDTGDYRFYFKHGLRDSLAPVESFGFSITKGKLDI